MEMGVSPRSVFQPEDVALTKSVLDEAATILPVARRTSAMKVRFASRILASAAKAKRDPVQLRTAALLGGADDWGW
jgi:hypothetical protein